MINAANQVLWQMSVIPDIWEEYSLFNKTLSQNITGVICSVVEHLPVCRGQGHFVSSEYWFGEI